MSRFSNKSKRNLNKKEIHINTKLREKKRENFPTEKFHFEYEKCVEQSLEIGMQTSIPCQNSLCMQLFIYLFISFIYSTDIGLVFCFGFCVLSMYVYISEETSANFFSRIAKIINI